MTPTAPGSGRPRIVVLGGGLIGGVHRRAALLAGADIVGVMASTPQRSEQVARGWGVQPVRDLGDLTALGPDVVHVCTPNALHLEQVTASFEAGAHVICEKPLTVSSGAADDLVALAERHDRIATVPYVYRFHPLVREIRARVRAGEFGRWQLLHGSYLQDWLLSPKATSWRVSARSGGPSRAFADIGSHWCDLMEFVTGERIASVMSSTSITVPERPATKAVLFGGDTDASTPLLPVDTEDAASVLFRTVSGVLGSVVVSQVSAGRRNRLWFEFDGAERSAVFDQENPETAWLGSSSTDTILHRDPAFGSDDQRRLSRLPAGHPEGYAQCFENFVDDTYAAVRGTHHDGLPTFVDGARSTRIIDAVLESAAAGRWADVVDPKAGPAAENKEHPAA